MQFSVKKLLIAISLFAALFAVIIAYRTYYQSHRTGVSASVANRMMWPGYELSNKASDVTYSVDFGGCEAEFAISEPDFLEWAKKRGWFPSKIPDTTTSQFEPILLPDNEKNVTNGYEFSVPYGEGIFDADRSRASFWVSTFP